MVAVGGAQVQLIDLPGLISAAVDGKGGGRSVLAAIRIADTAHSGSRPSSRGR